MIYRRLVKHLFKKSFPEAYQNIKDIVNSVKSQNYWDNLNITEKEINNFISYLNDYYPNLQVSVLDIGARGGVERSELSPIIKLKNKYLVGIEPEKEEAVRLLNRQENKYNECYDVALWNTEGINKLYVTKARGCTSLNEPNYDFFNKHKFITRSYFETEFITDVKTTTLKKLFKDRSFDFIKIDIQGGEYEVLSAADKSFYKNTVGIFSEAQTLEHYKNQHLLQDQLNLMNDLGFYVLKMFCLNREGIEAEQEIAFIKNMKFIDTKETFMKHILFSAIALQKNYIRYLCRVLGNKFLSQDELERLTHIFNFKPVPYDFVLPTDGMADSGY